LGYWGSSEAPPDSWLRYAPDPEPLPLLTSLRRANV
jgi:hypothetical protein